LFLGSLDTFAQRAKVRQHFGVYAKGSLDTFAQRAKGKKTFCSNEQKRVAPKKQIIKELFFFNK
jgi:hypothetical protein